jgi:Ca2+-binding RTX toxin-like protein
MTGFENLTGSNSFDDLRGDGGANVIDGLNAADLFQGRGGNDTLSDTGIGVSDQDTASYADATGGVTGSLVTNQVSGPGVGTDTLSGILGLDGSNFADTLIGNDADNGLGTVLNLLNGSAGDDTLEPRGGTDRLNGGADSDVVSYANDAAVTINLAAGTAVTGTTTDELSAIENAVGSPNNDTLTGSTGDNVLDGFGGDDHLDGGGGIDTASFASQPLGVDASLVTNTAFGQGSDTLANFENLTGSEQHDLLIGDGAANAFDGGPEEDTVAFTGLSQGVSASLVTNSATGQGSDTLTGIENLTGSDQDDTLTGDAGPNVLSGRDGADNLTGGLGADGFFLGDGLDVITADDGVVDAIDCEGTGPDSGSVDGPAPAETYNDCDSDGDSVVDFLDSCPTTSGAGADGCVPPVVTPPTQTTPTTPQAPAATTKKKCKKKKKHLAASVAKKKCKKKKR